MILKANRKKQSLPEFKATSLVCMVPCVLVQEKQQMSLLSHPSVMKQIITSRYSNAYVVVDKDGER